MSSPTRPYYLLILLFCVPIKCNEYSHILQADKPQEACEIICKVLHTLNKHVVIVSAKSETQAVKLNQRDIMQCVLMNLNNAIIQLGEDNVNVGDRGYLNLLFLESYESFKFVYSGLSMTSNDWSGSFLMVLSKSIQGGLDHVENIFKDCFLGHLLNVNIIVEKDTGQYSMYSYFPFSPEHGCSDTTPKRIDYSKDEPIDIHEIFPSYFLNMHGCPLFVYTWNNPPFVMFNSTTDQKWGGIEGKLLQSLSETMNFSLRLYNASDYTEISLRRPVEEILELLENDVVNLTLGNLRCSKERSKIVSSTGSYIQSAIVLLIHQPPAFKSLARLFLPFHKYVWISFLLVCCTAFVVTIILKSLGPTISRFVLGTTRFPNYSMWIGIVGGGITNPPRRNFARFLLILWLIFSLVLRSAYQGSLYDIIRMQRRGIKLPRNILEVITQNYTIRMSDFVFRTIENLHIPSNIEITNNITTLKMLIDLENSMDKIVLLSPKEYYDYHLKFHGNHTRIRIIKQRLYMQHNCMFFRRNSYLTWNMNRWLMIYQSSGLISKYTKDQLYFDPDVAFGVSQEPRILTTSSFSEISTLYGYLMGLSIFIFFMEILSYRISLLRRFLQFYNLY